MSLGLPYARDWRQRSTVYLRRADEALQRELVKLRGDEARDLTQIIRDTRSDVQSDAQDPQAIIDLRAAVLRQRYFHDLDGFSARAGAAGLMLFTANADSRMSFQNAPFLFWLKRAEDEARSEAEQRSYYVDINSDLTS